MASAVKQPGSNGFGCHTLTTALCNNSSSISSSTYSAPGLSERVRRLQEMIAARQSRPSHYSRIAKSRTSENKPLCSPNGLLAQASTSNSPDLNRLADNSLMSSSGEAQRQRTALCFQKGETFDDVKTIPKHVIRAKTEPAVMLGDEKEKRKTSKRYFGNLTSSRYLQHILAPIIGDSTKELKRCSSGKCSPPRMEDDDNVCAIVVPTDSTTQVPVIKRRNWLKSSSKLDKTLSRLKGNSATEELESDSSAARANPHLMVHDPDGTPISSQLLSTCKHGLKNSKFDDSYAIIRRQTKRLSYMAEESAVKSPSFLNSHRPKSVVCDSETAERSGKTKVIREYFENRSRSPINDDENINSQREPSWRSGSVLRHGDSFHKESGAELPTFAIDYGKRIIEDHDKEEREIDESSVSLRRPLVMVKNEDNYSEDIIFPNEILTNFGSISPSGRYLRDLRRPLPPLLEIQGGPDGNDGGTLAGDEKSTTSLSSSTRHRRRYMHSHTTSTYSANKDTAPDASPRRHLIGFLHRTSHLSLTSELSADASFYLIGHRGGRRFDDSTIGSESDARIFSDDDDRSRVSTSTDITSVSRQHQANAYRKRRNRRKFRQPSRASSFSSITESSMSLDVITVTLNMDTVQFLGISIVGQSNSRGDNGIYVANIMKGGAVALDGRIEPGDMILQVNDISFENFTNDQAVDVLRESVARKGPIKLTVAKMWDGGVRSAFTVPRHRDEPVRPIDTQAWVQHTNAMRGMPSILEGSEGAPTPVPGQYGRPPSSSTVTSNGSAPNTVIGGLIRLDITTDKKKVVQIMVMPNSGLDIKNRTWLKIPIPMSFLGSDLVDWLMEHVDGLRDRKDGRKYAGELLKEKLISHVVNKITFTEQCYYVLGEECAEFARLRQNPAPDDQAVRSEIGSILPPPPPGLMAAAAQQGARPWQQTNLMPQGAPSMVSGYASMPISPFPGQNMAPYSSGMATGATTVMYKGGGGPDVHSQTSSNDGSSGSEHRRAARAVLPPAPVTSLSSVPHHLQIGTSASMAAGPTAGISQNRIDDLPQDLASSRQSFRIAMSQPFEFFVDNL